MDAKTGDMGNGCPAAQPTTVRSLHRLAGGAFVIDTPAALQGGEAPGGAREGSDFQNLHRNKRSITLNLKDPDGLRIFRDLVRSADVAATAKAFGDLFGQFFSQGGPGGGRVRVEHMDIDDDGQPRRRRR